MSILNEERLGVQPQDDGKSYAERVGAVAATVATVVALDAEADENVSAGDVTTRAAAIQTLADAGIEYHIPRTWDPGVAEPAPREAFSE